MPSGMKAFWNYWQKALTPSRDIGRADLLVNTATGNLIARLHLLSLANRVPFSLDLYYNARDDFTGLFGKNITSLLDESLSEDPGTGDVTHRDATGATHLYTRNPDGSYNHPPGIYNTLTRNPDGTFDLKVKGAATLRFGAGHLKLIRARDRNGNAWVIERNAQAQPVRVYDEATGTNLLDLIVIHPATGLVVQIGFSPALYTEDPNGWRWQMAYSAGRELTTATDPAGNSLALGWASGLLSLITDYRGNSTALAFQPGTHRLASITDPLGNATSFAYDDPTRTTTLTDASLHLWRYTHNENGSLTDSEDPVGNKWKFVWDTANNLLLETEDPRSTPQDPVKTVHTWDVTRGNLLSITDPMGGVTQFDYDLYDEMIETRDPLGRLTRYTRDQFGNIVSITSPAQNVTQIQRNARGDATKVTDPEGWETKFEYDPVHGNKTAEKRVLMEGGVPRDITTTFAYNSVFTRMVRQTDPEGHPTDFLLDALWRVTVTRRYLNGNPVDATSEYDANSNVTATIDAMGNRTTNAYDAANRRTSVTNALNEVTQFGYDPVGNLTSVTMPDGAVYRKTYYPNNRLFEEIDPLNHTTRHFYDPAGNEVMLVKPRGNQFRKVYDTLSRVVKDIGPLPGMEVQYFYDAASQRVRTLLPNGGEILEEYDLDGRRTRVTDPEGGITSWEYLRNGLVKAERDPIANENPANPDTLRHDYDTLGRKVKTTDALGGTEEWQYSDRSLVTRHKSKLGGWTEYAHDDLGRVIQETDPVGGVSRKAYDLNSQLTQEITPAGATYEHTRDALNRIIRTRVSFTEGGVPKEYIYGKTYSNRGWVATETEPNGSVTRYIRDAAGRLIRRCLDEGGANICESWGYDENDNMDAYTDPLGNVFGLDWDMADRPITARAAGPNQWTFEWDLMNHLVRITYPTGDTEEYIVDRSGRVVHTRYNGQTQEQKQVDKAGRLILLTDDEGRQMVYERDLLGQVTKVTFKPDPLDPTQDVTRQFTLDAAGNTTAVIDAMGKLWQQPRDLLGRIVRIIAPTGESMELGYDAAGNTTHKRDFAGNITRYEHNPIGQLLKATYPDGSEVTFKWNCCRVTQIEDALGITDIHYDSLFRVIWVLDALGNDINYEWQGLDFIRRMILPGNQVFEWIPNNLGLPTTLKLPDLTTVGFQYNALGQRIGETLPNGWQGAHTTSNGDFVRQSTFAHPAQNLTIQQQRTYQGYSGRTTGFHSDALPTPVAMGKFDVNVEYYKNGSIKREIVRVAGQVVYQRRYEWDKNWNLTQTLDELGGWRAEYGLDDAGRLVRINTIAGAGSNPFPWPVGLTTVTTDANGSIRALVNGTWRAEFEVDYEGRLTEIRWPGYNTVRFVYDGVGRKLKELQIDPNTGQVVKESRFVLDGETPVEERDGNNNKVEEYAWDGGRLLRRKIEATGEKQWTQSQISGTPVRLMDDAGKITGGMVWTREGQKAAGVNDGSYPFGWNSERFAGGAPASGGLPFMLGAYLTALHRGIPSSLAPTWILPELSLPSASNQAVFSVRQTPLLPSAVWSEVLGVDGKEPTPPSGPSVDGASTTDCLWCCVEEGTTKKWLKNLPRPVCPSGLPAKIVGEDQIMKHTGERKCLVSCPKKKGKAVVWEAHWAGATGKEAEKAKHCCNSGGCCPLVADCGVCQAIFSCASGKWEPVAKKSRAFKKGPFGIGGWHLECPGFCVTWYAPSLSVLGTTISCLVMGRPGFCIVSYNFYTLISAKCAEAVIAPPDGYTPKCGALIPTCEVRNVTPHAKCDCPEGIKFYLEAKVHGCKYIPCGGS